jgi:hypothetical protein
MKPVLSLKNKPLILGGALLTAVALVTFLLQLVGGHPQRAWQAYLINFLVWSAIAQGGLLFSALMHLVKARWTGRLSSLAEAFTAFFPLSFVLFLGLFLGSEHIFPWLHEDLHGKEVWLNVPFLFWRDCVGLLLLYGLGFGYLYHALKPKLVPGYADRGIRGFFTRGQTALQNAPERWQQRKTVFGLLYIIAFALVLSLIGFDLVMSMDPHWISTLFGAYTFVKAFYIGLGGLIILAAVMRLNQGEASGLSSSQFHDLGKLFFAFCLVWGDFFYVQLVVIWYGNIPEESSYVIERVMRMPWKPLAWAVFAAAFIIPFVLLINKKIKTRPVIMMALCTLIIAGIWLEHLLLIGPAFAHGAAAAIPVGLTEALITLGFMSLMILALAYFMDLFPEIAMAQASETT